MTTRPNIGVNVEGTGPSEKSIVALTEAIVQIFEAGADREERLAALAVLSNASSGGINLSNNNFITDTGLVPEGHKL